MNLGNIILPTTVGLPYMGLEQPGLTLEVCVGSVPPPPDTVEKGGGVKKAGDPRIQHTIH